MRTANEEILSTITESLSVLLRYAAGAAAVSKLLAMRVETEKERERPFGLVKGELEMDLEKMKKKIWLRRE
jgi:hypothetical protein